jgi:hypothetical protein
MEKAPRPTRAERVYRQEHRKRARVRLAELNVAVTGLSNVDPPAFSPRALDKSRRTLDAFPKK